MFKGRRNHPYSNVPDVTNVVKKMEHGQKDDYGLLETSAYNSIHRQGAKALRNNILRLGVFAVKL
jgi:hypothetical protein